MRSSVSRGLTLVVVVIAAVGVLAPVGTADGRGCEDSGRFARGARELCGRTTIRASEVGALDVVLRDQAVLTIPTTGRWRFKREASNVWLRGGGDFAGFVLQRTGRSDGRAFLVGGRIGGAQGWDFFNYLGFERVTGGIEIPPGRYRVTLAPSRGDIALTLDLPTLSGTRIYSASRPVAGKVFTGPMGAPVAGDAGLYSFGLDGPSLGERHLGIAAVWGRASRHIATAVGSCFYGPGGRAGEGHQYAPGCPSRGSNYKESRQTVVSVPPADDFTVGYVKVAPALLAGRWGIGAWIAAEHGLADPKIALVWIDVE